MTPSDRHIPRHFVILALTCLLLAAHGIVLRGTLLRASTDAETHGMRMYASPLDFGSAIPSLEAHLGGHQQAIVVRYLGFSCAHCVEQLTYLNRYADRLRGLGVIVLAFSPDTERRNRQLAARFGYDTSVIRLVADPDNQIARAIGAVRTEDDTLRDLHAAIVMRHGTVVLSAYSDQPYMDIEHLVSKATNAATNAATNVQMLGQQPHSLDRYLEGGFTNVVMAGPADGIVGPVDLDFNKSPLHPDDLWVVTTDDRGYGIAILHNATDPERRVLRLKKDSRASHFMWRTQAIAMGQNGTFGTMQSGEPGQGDPFYQFMGPTLWSSDTAVFASRYQDERRILASHLDMLHQSPMGLGMAHERDNIYWVTDGYYNSVHRYDFRDPHEVGGTDHRDGIIRRYSDARLTKGERGRPAHIALDDDKRWLYVIDPGSNRLFRCDITTGSEGGPLVPPDESMENLARFTEWTGMIQQDLPLPGLQEPVGIAVIGDRLLVGDRSTGLIHVAEITENGISALGTVATEAQELLGITVGPDQQIWYVDRAAGTVHCLEFQQQPTIRAERDVAALDVTDSLTFFYASVTDGPHRFAVTVVGSDAEHTDTLTVLDAAVLRVPITLSDSLQVYTVQVQDLGSGVQASTIVAHRGLQRVIADDAPMETFRFPEAVLLTDRRGYVPMRSDVFLRLADSLTHLRVVAWNGGSSGELSPADEAVLTSVMQRNVSVLFVADDPCLVRTETPGSEDFFALFGASVQGADLGTNENGQRLFSGIPGDSVSGGLGLIDCQLARLDHHRGGDFVPNVLFEPVGAGLAVLFGYQSSTVGAVRSEELYRRTVLVGINMARWLDGLQRTQFLDQSLAWLEATPTEIIDDTTTSVGHPQHSSSAVALAIHGTESVTPMAVVRGVASDIQLDLFAATGQRLARLYAGPVDGEVHIPINVASIARGTHFVVLRHQGTITHRSIIVR